MPLFGVSEYYPHLAHTDRIRRYRENKKLFLGRHYEAFVRDALVYANRLSRPQMNILYISTNLPGVICKKSADFLFGETPTYSAGKTDDSPEQAAIDRIVEENELNIANYESALGNAYRGDSFYKVRYGQMYDGDVDKSLDPYRVIIEAQNPEYVFPEHHKGDKNKVIAYHVAYPTRNGDEQSIDWTLHVESHYVGRIEYSEWLMNPAFIDANNDITEWRIYAEDESARRVVNTGVPFHLIVHVPNYATDESWHGIDDLTEHKALFDEINHRLSQISQILDKHADPAMVVPAGTLGEDENGNPTFRVGVDKVFEVMGKDDLPPSYITWNGQLEAAFRELEQLTNMVLMNAELPQVALGAGDAGTSGSSGLAIKFRMNSLLAKINRKRQYYDKALKRVILTAQLLEEAVSSKLEYEPTTPRIKFFDGLPRDEMEQAQIMSLRTGGKSTISTKSALMSLDGLTEEQAEAELARIKEDEAIANPTAFQTPATDGGTSETDDTSENYENLYGAQQTEQDGEESIDKSGGE